VTRSTFDSGAFWAGKPTKKWVVSLESGTSFNRKTDLKYVSAQEQSGAVQCALANTHLQGARATGVRLATPEDLGCTQVATR